MSLSLFDFFTQLAAGDMPAKKPEFIRAIVQLLGGQEIEVESCSKWLSTCVCIIPL